MLSVLDILPEMQICSLNALNAMLYITLFPVLYIYFSNIFYAWKSSYDLALTLKNLPSGFADNKAQTSLHIHADR